jgi:hypothetical protein
MSNPRPFSRHLLRAIQAAALLSLPLTAGPARAGWPMDGLPLTTGIAAYSKLEALAPAGDRVRICPDAAGGFFVAWSQAGDNPPPGTRVHDVFARHVLADGSIDPSWPADDASDGAWAVSVAWRNPTDRSETGTIAVVRLCPNGLPDAGRDADGVSAAMTEHAVDPPRIAEVGNGEVRIAFTHPVPGVETDRPAPAIRITLSPCDRNAASPTYSFRISIIEADCVEIEVLEASEGVDRALTGESRPLRRETVFNPAPPSQARWFFLTETTASWMLAPASRYRGLLLTNSLGMMCNFGASNAIGWSVDLHQGNAQFQIAPMLRYRHWFDEHQSFDVAAGYLAGRTYGLAGPIAYVRYSPTPMFHLHAGVAGIRSYDYTLDPQGYPRYHERRRMQTFAGLGFGGVPGAVLMGAQVLLFGSFIAILASGYS